MSKFAKLCIYSIMFIFVAAVFASAGLIDYSRFPALAGDDLTNRITGGVVEETPSCNLDGTEDLVKVYPSAENRLAIEFKNANGGQYNTVILASDSLEGNSQIYLSDGSYKIHTTANSIKLNELFVLKNGNKSRIYRLKKMVAVQDLALGSSTEELALESQNNTYVATLNVDGYSYSLRVNKDNMTSMYITTANSVKENELFVLTNGNKSRTYMLKQITPSYSNYSIPIKIKIQDTILGSTMEELPLYDQNDHYVATFNVDGYSYSFRINKNDITSMYISAGYSNILYTKSGVMMTLPSEGLQSSKKLVIGDVSLDIHMSSSSTYDMQVDQPLGSNSEILPFQNIGTTYDKTAKTPKGTCIKYNAESDVVQIYFQTKTTTTPVPTTALCEVGGHRCEKLSNGTYTGFEQNCYNASQGWVNGNMCELGCNNLTGRCKLPTTSCRDTDGGKNFSVKGVCSDGFVDISDFCQDSLFNGVYEAYCNQTSGLCVQAPFYSVCPAGCSNGACNPVPVANETTLCEVGGYRCEKNSNGNYTGWFQTCYNASQGWVNTEKCNISCDGLTGKCSLKPTSSLTLKLKTGDTIRIKVGTSTYVTYYVLSVGNDYGKIRLYSPTTDVVLDMAKTVSRNNVTVSLVRVLDEAENNYYYAFNFKSDLNKIVTLYDLQNTLFCQQTLGSIFKCGTNATWQKGCLGKGSYTGTSCGTLGYSCYTCYESIDCEATIGPKFQCASPSSPADTLAKHSRCAYGKAYIAYMPGGKFCNDPVSGKIGSSCYKCMN